jgi:hypothetical protein
MTKDSYPGLFHNIHRAMNAVSFPIEKTELLHRVGELEIRVDWEKSASMRALIEPIEQGVFSCAADFYCALIARLQAPENSRR